MDLKSRLLSLAPGIEEAQAAKLVAYVELLAKWNRTYNLTAVRDPEQMLYQHILDSLSVIPSITERFPAGTPRILDVGTGGGLPGIPLAITLPGAALTLLDSNHKKTTFLRQAVIDLELPNVTVECARIEAIAPGAPFDIIISRAFSDLAEFARLVSAQVAPQTLLFAMKGLYPYDELNDLEGVEVESVVPLAVPGLDAQRHLVILRKPKD